MKNLHLIYIFLNSIMGPRRVYKGAIHWEGESVGMTDSDEKVLENFIEDSLRYGRVLRLSDVRSYATEKHLDIKLKRIKEILNLKNEYMMNRPQQRQPKRDKKYRPIVVNDLGHWHSDIGFFAINKRYPTPLTFRAGYLVAKDVLSRYIYATPLLKNRTADSIVRAFKILMKHHAETFPGVVIKSISFDKETSVVGKKVQKFLADQSIAFHAFQLSDSKAKHAENAIKQIRATTEVLLRRNNKKDRWWNLLPTVLDTLNSRPVVVNGKSLGFAPRDVNSKTLEEFKKKLFKVAPSYYWAQYSLAPDWVSWKYEVGTVVRAKLIAVSSAVIGNKRSEVNLTDDLFVIREKVPYVTRNMEYGKAYRCQNLEKGYSEVFQEDEIALGREDINRDENE